MHIPDATKSHANACKLINRRRIADAIVVLRKLISDSGHEYLAGRLDALQETYVRLLQHSFVDVPDPERDKVYGYLLRSLLELADELMAIILVDQGTDPVSRLKREGRQQAVVKRQEAMQILEGMYVDDALSDLLREANVAATPGDGSDDAGRETALTNLFGIVWLTDTFSDEDVRLIEAICDSGKLPWHDKALIVSALTLSLLRYFEAAKFLLLFRFVEQQEPIVWERAMVGLFVGFLHYNDRYHLYPVLAEKTQDLRSSVPAIQQHLEAIVLQYAKSRGTEHVKRKWEEEILPEIMKVRPIIEKKLDLNNLFSDHPEEEKNPDWETVFEDTPDLLNKLQELTEMQMDGMDVFISAFAQLKHFPFFGEISNWFAPFYKENPAVRKSVGSESDAVDLSPLVEKLESAFFMCNSDKYSFCLNLALVPEQQKSMMMNMLNAEMENIAGHDKDQELLQSIARSKSIYTQYFQDLYRFYKLHPWRKAFGDIFDMEMDLYETRFVKDLVSDDKTIRNIAEFLFDRQLYDDALRMFHFILEKDKSNLELFEKIAFCYEKTGDIARACEYYQKADLKESDRLWILRKMAWTCKLLNRWEEALSHYRRAEKQDPEDMRIQASIGQCLIHLERYEEALDCYFKVEVLAPENHKIRRPLAWCSFLLGKFTVARDYLERLLDAGEGTHYDMMNLGHVHWCEGKPDRAFSLYVQCVLQWKSIKAFEASFAEDRKHLGKHGVSAGDMDLMMDYVKLEVRSRKKK